MIPGIPRVEFYDLPPHNIMTLREYYAGLAMFGYLSEGYSHTTSPGDISLMCIRQANSLIEALNSESIRLNEKTKE